MDELPELAIEKILKYLNLTDLCRCRLINKYLNSFIKNYIGINNLLIIKRKDYFYNDNGEILNNEIINKINQIERINLNIPNNEFMRTILSRLKKISLKCYSKKANENDDDDSDYDINSDYGFNYIEFLNQFEQFNQLEEINIENLEIKENLKLKLTNLKLISISRKYFKRDDLFDDFKLTLECSNLRSFHLIEYHKLKSFQFIYPLTIRNLILNETNFELIELFKFKNIENLIIYTYSPNNQWIDSFNSKLFPNLKSIYLNENIIYPQLINLRKELDKTIDLYFYGFKIEKKINYNYLFDEDDKFIIEDSDFYSLLLLRDEQNNEILKFNSEYFLNYDQLIQLLDLLPDNQLSKFMNIKELDLNNDELSSTNLINNLERFKGIIFGILIEECSFNQEFYDNLIILKYLKSIILTNFNKPIDNFEFLFKHQYLNSIVIDEKISFDLIRKLLKNLKYLNNLECKTLKSQFKLVNNFRYKCDFELKFKLIYRSNYKFNLKIKSENEEELIKNQIFFEKSLLIDYLDKLVL